MNDNNKNMWKINNFNKWIKDGRPINENIFKLDISNSNIKNFGDLENLINLEKLYCNKNKLKSLEGIENLVNLKELYCDNNKLTSLEGMENLVNLENLYCNNNQLTSLKGIENLINLNKLYCYDNQLTSLEGIEIFVKFIKNNKQTIHNIKYDFIDIDDYVELKELFHNLIKSENGRQFNKYIKKIEKMIVELNGFQNYVLK
jgi:Leucine-rich repeat (LRR) protein